MTSELVANRTLNTVEYCVIRIAGLLRLTHSYVCDSHWKTCAGYESDTATMTWEINPTVVVWGVSQKPYNSPCVWQNVCPGTTQCQKLTRLSMFFITSWSDEFKLNLNLISQHEFWNTCFWLWGNRSAQRKPTQDMRRTCKLHTEWPSPSRSWTQDLLTVRPKHHPAWQE